MRDEIVILIWPLDEKTDEETEVFASIESVGHKEFFAAAQSGYKALYKIAVWDSEYDGQPYVRIGENKYSVYRTYKRTDDKMELFVTDKIGA